MANFEKAINVVLNHEGGYVNDPNDSGGETKFGISKRSYPNLDIKNLTVDQAKEIYRKDFWLKSRFNEITNDDVATKVFDTAVNMGPADAIKYMQMTCNSIANTRLVVDGINGSKTLSVVNSIDGALFLPVYRKLQELHYRKLVMKEPSKAKFLEGWLKRASS